MEKVTFINSIGVKSWISWHLKILVGCKLEIVHAPFVIINQINIVHGFYLKRGVCNRSMRLTPCDCGNEMNYLFQRGKDFEYKDGANKEWINIPETLPCKKCGKSMEPDFIDKKIVGFLSVE